MRTPFLFLITLFSIAACSPEKPNQQEALFYQRLIDDEKLSVQNDLARMRRWVNERGPYLDLPILIKAENLSDQIDLALKKNKVYEAHVIIQKELKLFHTDEMHIASETINEMKYMDSLFIIDNNSIANLKYRVSIYNGLKRVIENYIFQFGTYCGLGNASKAYYDVENYKLNDTLQILVFPPGLPDLNQNFMRGNELNKFYKKHSIQKAEYTNYHLINIETKDTLPIIVKPVNKVLLVSTMIPQRGNYLLKGSFKLVIDNMKYLNLFTTNELIQVK